MYPNHVSQQYWILGGQPAIKSYILRCGICAKQRGIRTSQLLGQLPLARVTPSRPYTHTGVDYAGPLTKKTWKGREAKTYKAWICVFVCLAISAVHRDAVSDNSSEAFIAAYRRFSSHKGIQRVLHSDCGTTFVGSDKDIKKLFIQCTTEHHHITNIHTDDHARWEFNPPAAPHMGEKYEAVVKSIKFHLKRSTTETLLTIEEIMTLLSQIEAILNSRPVQPLNDNPEYSNFRISRWQLLQQRVQKFWTQWTIYNNNSQHRSGIIQEMKLKLDPWSSSLIKDYHHVSGSSPVIKLHPGKD
ncbi:PREDICTED: uncharacterized protein LOC105365951 [Ceratosolen solmsi marchali]|uniref:Uncharacterized protein LOC105365951 n=1 Tax=Ceratosolen solmsi marchali TaxID=326594 RepID=A0AAJ6YQR9_9HYME|nr:PREDICTED: uncharacterized protein LOC105365951 [Ceratosolen solmsi marchali]